MEVWIALAVILVVGYLVLRRPAASRRETPRITIEVSRSGSGRRRLDPRGLTSLADVVPIPPPAGWPALPPEPPGLDGAPPPEQYIEVADREYARNTCPSCGVELNPLPKAKKRCKECGKEIFVRSGPDGRRHLLAATELDGWQVVWADHHAARSKEAAARQERAELEWRGALARAGVRIGEYELDVVGESHRHAALAGIRAALVSSPDDFEVRAIAALEREPENRHDRNAIRVVIHGQMVGYLSRYDAEEYQVVLKRFPGPFYVQAVLMGGRPTDDGRVGPIGVRLEDVPEP